MEKFYWLNEHAERLNKVCKLQPKNKNIHAVLVGLVVRSRTIQGLDDIDFAILLHEIEKCLDVQKGRGPHERFRTEYLKTRTNFDNLEVCAKDSLKALLTEGKRGHGHGVRRTNVLFLAYLCICHERSAKAFYRLANIWARKLGLVIDGELDYLRFRSFELPVEEAILDDEFTEKPITRVAGLLASNLPSEIVELELNPVHKGGSNFDVDLFVSVDEVFPPKDNGEENGDIGISLNTLNLEMDFADLEVSPLNSDAYITLKAAFPTVEIKTRQKVWHLRFEKQNDKSRLYGDLLKTYSHQLVQVSQQNPAAETIRLTQRIKPLNVVVRGCEIAFPLAENKQIKVFDTILKKKISSRLDNVVSLSKLSSGACDETEN